MNALAKSLVSNEYVKETFRVVQEFCKTGGNRLTKPASIAKYQVELFNVASSVIRVVLKEADFVALAEDVLYTDETRTGMDDVLAQGSRKASKITQEQIEC